MQKIKQYWAEIVLFVAIFIAIASAFSAISANFDRRDNQIELQREIIDVHVEKSDVYKMYIKEFTTKK